MPLPPLPDVRWLTVDPGETVGWALWEGRRKIDGGQTPLWEFLDAVAEGLEILSVRADVDGRIDEWRRFGTDATFAGIKLIVCEDFVLYPWEIRDGTMDFDSVETARGIGALTLIARLADIPFELQGANIKAAAKAAGAEDIFVRPLHPNRHENDATMHGVWRCAQEGPWVP